MNAHEKNIVQTLNVWKDHMAQNVKLSIFETLELQ